MKKEKKKISFTITAKKPRGIMPPPSKRFVDRKKKANKLACRKGKIDA